MKKLKNKQAIKASKLAKAQNMQNKIITVKNAEGEPDTKAEILIQNKINYTPKVSVIIPVYNVEEYLRECLDSVVNQTLKEIEIICVDDGSTDNSLEILKEYAKKDSRITVITQQNLHAGVARNAGLAVAKGEYVHFLDSDDWVEKNIYTIIPSKDQNDIIMFDSFKVDKILDKKISWKKSYLDCKKVSTNINIYEFENAPNSPWGKLFSRKFIEKFNLKFQNLRCCNDIYFIKLSIALAEKILLVDEILYNWRFNAHGNISSTRGAYSECIVKAAELLKLSLIKENVFPIYKNVFYETISKSFIYEYSQCIPENREILFKLYQNFLPEPYLSEVKDKISPEISIIMPVYNAEKTLNRAIDSVLKQTYRNFELVCVNDGSIDDSENILNFYKRFDERVQVFHKINEGPGIARNKGINIARGKYITFLDADDTLTPNALEVYLETIKNTKADIVIARYNYYSYLQKTVTKQGGHYSSKLIVNAEELKDNLYTISNPVVWNKFYKKDLIVKNNIYFPNLKSSEDVYFCGLLLSYVKKIAFLSSALINWTYDNNSSLHYTSKSKNFEESYIVYLKLKEELERRNQFTRNENAFIKSFTHTCMWSLENMTIDKDEAISIVQKYIKLLDIQHNEYFYNRLKVVINELTNRRNIIISLTSYPARIGTVNQTIESLLNQTMKADKVILWLAPEQFPNKEKDLPEHLLALCDKGLTIDWYHDIKSYKKLIPTLKKYPEAIIVTADDDLLYDKNWLLYLYNSYLTEKNVIHCHRITRLYNIGNQLRILDRNLYLNKKNCYREDIKKASYFNKLSGGAGTLYPPHSLHKDVLDEETFMQLAPTSDDIWFYIQAIRNNYRVKVVDNNLYILNYIPGTQNENCLCRINDISGNKIFYLHLYTLINKYPETKQQFNEDNIQNKQTIFSIYQNMKIMYKQELQTWYQRVTGKYLNLDNPRTFNEKIQWLKLYDSTPIKTRLADKYLVRDWVKEQIGEQYLIPLLGVYDKFEDIDFAKLPNQFVIKCNHGCAYNIIVKDKSKLDLAEAKAKLDKWMSENFAFKAGYELHYRDIKPKIIIEKFIENKGTDDLYDYKFWCFNGKLAYIQFLSERNLSGLKMAFYDRKWNKQTFVYSHPLDKKTIKKPDNLDEMIQLAEALSKGFPCVRVDFYRLNDGTIYFGEMTFTSASGNCKWNDEHINRTLGNMIKLPKLAYNIDTGEYYKLPKKSKLKPWLLLPYNLLKQKYLQEKYQNAQCQSICRQLKSMRIDIKNFGKAENGTDIATAAKVSRPAWFANEQGQGCVAESCGNTEKLSITCRGAGKLRLEFRGSDKRFDGTRFPLWIDYKSIKINGKEQLTAPVATWHDKPYRFEMPVKDGQVVTVEVVQQYHQYAKDELKDVILKLNPNSDYIRQNINRLTDKIYDKITVKPAAPRVKKPKAASNQELLASIAALNARIERLEQENRERQAQLLAAINTLKKA